MIRSIREVSQDDQMRFWSFIHYVSSRHPDILRVKLEEETRERCEAIIVLANPPPVTFEESERAKIMGKLKERMEARDQPP